MKRLVLLCIVIFFLMYGGILVDANYSNTEVAPISSFEFSDVLEDNWAYEPIMFMVERGVLKGYPDNTFKPSKEVSRAEFATIMVKAFNLKVIKPETPFFLDVSKSHWAFSFVESSKQYLTGFRTNIGDYYRPSLGAVREDMAVALVKGLKLGDSEANQDYINDFDDKSKISVNLRDLVSIAIENNLMKGYPEDANGYKLFKPQGNLTRAEAATLIYNALGMQKVTYEEDIGTKVTYDDTVYTTEDNEYALGTSLNGYYEGKKILLKWSPVASEKFKYYKVVVSKSDSSPKYPENGYLVAISDINKTHKYIDNSSAYHNGDFGKYLIPGETYHFNITSVYDGMKVPSNTITLKYPGEQKEIENKSEDISVTEKTPSLIKIESYGDKLNARWTQTSSYNFKYYKIVLSKHNSTPEYPKDGYLKYITDSKITNYVFKAYDGYQGGDVGGKLIAGNEYYVAITAVYNEGKYTSNALKVKIP